MVKNKVEKLFVLHNMEVLEEKTPENYPHMLINMWISKNPLFCVNLRFNGFLFLGVSLYWLYMLNALKRHFVRCFAFGYNKKLNNN